METLSELNITFEDFNLRFSGEFEDEYFQENNSGVIDNVVQNTVDSNSCWDSIYNKTDVNNNHRSTYKGTNKQNDYWHQNIDVPKLLRQLSSARVVLEKLPISISTEKIRNTENLADNDFDGDDATTRASLNLDIHVESSEKSDATNDHCYTVNDTKKKGVNSIYIYNRYCPKCKIIIKNAAGLYGRWDGCRKCRTLLEYECPKCGKIYGSLSGVRYHLATKCSAKHLDLKCSKCSYRTTLTILLKKHQNRNHSLEDVIHRCKICSFTTKFKSSMVRHMGLVHKER